MIELPAAAAHDQLRGTDTRQRVALQLMAAIDMIDRVYPALDTADTRAGAEKLVGRLLEDMAFAPEAAPTAPVAPADPQAHDHPYDHPHDPVNVPVMPDTEGTAITMTSSRTPFRFRSSPTRFREIADVHPDRAE